MLRKYCVISMLALILVACGGGGGGGKNPVAEGTQSFTFSAYKDKAVYLSSDLGPATEPWITLSLQPTFGLTPEQSIKAQANVPGSLVLFAGQNKVAPYEDFFTYVDLASINPRFEYVYVYDELFWTGTKDEIGWREDEVVNASDYVRSKGMRAIVDILPYTILNPEFTLKNYNAFDVIAINVYPSGVVNKDTYGCQYNNNLYTNLLYCSQKKLRDSGFKGEVWYVYQAFGVTSGSPQQLEANFKLQQETIKIAPSFGITTVLPFGLYLGKAELNAEPYLVPGKGSSFEALVNPS